MALKKVIRIPKRGELLTYKSDINDSQFTQGSEYRVHSYQEPYVYIYGNNGDYRGRPLSRFAFKVVNSYAVVQFDKNNKIIAHYGPFTTSEEAENWITTRKFDRNDMLIITLNDPLS